MMRSHDERAPVEAPIDARVDPVALSSVASAGRTPRDVVRGLRSAYHDARSRLTGRNAVLLCRYVLLRLRRRNLCTGYVHVGRGADIVIGSQARVHFGREVCFMRDFTGHFMGRVTLGDGVFFNRSCHVVVQESLTVGDYSLFGEGVSIHDDNHVMGRGREPIASRGLITRPVVIGRNVWVGARAVILPGVHIGDNAVVGAGAVVTRDVPPYTVVAGVPARVIKEV
jgi:acetyltransferase-like isoleucine patch superfamily enzyme